MAFRHFLDSQDPAAVFPAVFLDVRGAAMLQLLDNKLQLEKMIDISDYAGELLSHAQPTPGVLHTSHSLTLRLPQLGAHYSLGVTETPCEPAVQSLAAQPGSRRQTDSLSHLESARVNSHSLSGLSESHTSPWWPVWLPRMPEGSV